MEIPTTNCSIIIVICFFVLLHPFGNLFQAIQTATQRESCLWQENAWSLLRDNKLVEEAILLSGYESYDLADSSKVTVYVLLE